MGIKGIKGIKGRKGRNVLVINREEKAKEKAKVNRKKERQREWQLHCGTISGNFETSKFSFPRARE